MRMEILGYRLHGSLITTTDHLQKHQRTLKGMAGFVLLVAIRDGLSNALFLALHAMGKPVVIIDEIGCVKLPGYALHSGRFLLIDAWQIRYGAGEVARTLIALKHRRVAFFSPFFADHWSQACLQGLMETFAAAGPEYAVTPFTLAYSLIDIEAKARSPEKTRKSIDRLIQQYNRYRTDLSDASAKQFDPIFSVLLNQHVDYASYRELLQPLFASALADRSITCWVASDIDTAWFTNDYIQEHNPGLSLITFGWSPEVTNSRIAAYDFNAAAAVRATIAFLLYPKKRLPGQEGMNLRVMGSIIQRESLRPAFAAGAPGLARPETGGLIIEREMRHGCDRPPPLGQPSSRNPRAGPGIRDPQAGSVPQRRHPDRLQRRCLQ